LGNPCLADFGLSSIAEDIYSAGSSKFAGGGSIRWFAPELVDPAAGQRGTWVKHTTQSDIYSLAMVIVEVTSKSAAVFSIPYEIHFLFPGVHRKDTFP